MCLRMFASQIGIQLSRERTMIRVKKSFGSKPNDLSSLPVGLVYVEKSTLFPTVAGLRNLVRKGMDIFQLQ